MGQRGARTRQAIVTAALDSFEAKGFHATHVDDIAESVGISRATLYQYFASKEDLFVELVHEGGAELLRLIRRLGAIGPTAEGYDNLHWWLGQFAWVYDKYRAVFLQWALVDSPQAPLRPLMGEFVESYTAPMASRIASAVDHRSGLHADDVAVTLLAVLLRVNDYRYIGVNRGLTDDELLDGVTTFVQLALFPSTPASALVADTADATATRGRPAGPSARRRPRPRRVNGRLQPDPERFGTSSPALLLTVQRLLDAGATVFAARGFHAASVEEILREAKLGRGTFYKYFDDKASLLVTLAEDCAVRLEELVEALAGALGDDDRPASLRRWLRDAVAFHRRYRSVFRAWTEQIPVDPAFAELGVRSAESLLLGFEDALAMVERDYPFDLRVGSVVLSAMFERVPDYAFGTAYQMSDEQVVEVLAGLIERGLLRHQPARNRRREAPAARATRDRARSGSARRT